jgi:hypothetical protein
MGFSGHELIPFMRYLLEGGTLFFLVVKIGLALLFTFLLLHFAKEKLLRYLTIGMGIICLLNFVTLILEVEI